MAEEKDRTSKTLEMRVAELEDKMQKVHVTEEEMRAFNKVASLMGVVPPRPRRLPPPCRARSPA
jgi:hypothetical protein